MSTPPHIHRDLSSDNLVANGTTSTNRGDKSDKPYDRPESKHRSFSKSHPSQPSSTAKHGIRRYKLFENKQTTWLFGGRMMTGGDNPVSVLTTLVIILGLSGVWVGTTGVWLWQHGTEYGLAKGGGIAVVIIFV
jgi:palmitoyltransferase ZDHHC9/14/18